ncbi:MAG: T9SS type A sorting domain-containing protein [Ignavibacteriae bacterium]|nr:T9SS type A sorting domain-containing protein [Ignavibacteriota bacterium]
MLDQNYPNPFNPSTKIQFSLLKAADVSLKIYNMLGQEVAEIMHEKLNPGAHIYEWDGTSREGKPVASGMYFYRLTAGQFVETKKMVLLK